MSIVLTDWGTASVLHLRDAHIVCAVALVAKTPNLEPTDPLVGGTVLVRLCAIAPRVADQVGRIYAREFQAICCHIVLSKDIHA